jgi:methylmalonyl-CoA mutase
VAAVKAGRDSGGAAATLRALEQATRAGTLELMPLIVNAVRARCSVGEISDALEAVWGRYK